MNKNQNQNSGYDTGSRDLLLVVSIVICSVFYKYRFAIEYWFHKNLIELVLGSIFLVTLLGYISVKRMKEKNREQIERMERLRYSQAPRRPMQSFYKKSQDHFPGERE